jgi:hypothetical protein
MLGMDLERLKCRFGCSSPVFGVYHLPEGCVCWPDPVQALCLQHSITAQSTGPIEVIMPREELGVDLPPIKKRPKRP